MSELAAPDAAVDLEEVAGVSGFFNEPAGLRIALRQAALFLVVGGLVVAALVGAAYRLEKREVVAESAAEVARVAAAAAAAMNLSIQEQSVAEQQYLLHGLVGQLPPSSFGAIYGGDGALLAHTVEGVLPAELLKMSAPDTDRVNLQLWGQDSALKARYHRFDLEGATLQLGVPEAYLAGRAVERVAPLLLLGLALLLLASTMVFAATRPTSRDAELLALELSGQSPPRLGAARTSPIARLFSAVSEGAQRSESTPIQPLAEASDAELQENINNFLAVATDVAMGDMTRRGRVTADVLGSVVDAINVVLERLDGTLYQVRDAAEAVAQGSDRAQEASTLTGTAVREQLQLVEGAQREISTAQGLAKNIAEQAQQSSAASAETVNAATQGRAAVQTVRDEMSKVRRQVLNASRRIKSLGERSLEVSEIAETIATISYQTNLLAVNAAIEASGAGEAGKRFSVVAEEVRKLAEDTSHAARKIEDLVSDFQPEVQETVAAMDKSSGEVEQSFRAAESAEERLSQIATFAGRSDEFARDILGRSGQQVQEMNEVASAFHAISAQSEASEKLAGQVNDVSTELRTRADVLLGQLLEFRLSEGGVARAVGGGLGGAASVAGFVVAGGSRGSTVETDAAAFEAEPVTQPAGSAAPAEIAQKNPEEATSETRTERFVLPVSSSAGPAATGRRSSLFEPPKPTPEPEPEPPGVVGLDDPEDWARGLDLDGVYEDKPDLPR